MLNMTKVTLAVVLLLSTSSLCFVPQRNYSSSSSSVVLHMGLKNFIKNRILKKDDDEDDGKKKKSISRPSYDMIASPANTEEGSSANAAAAVQRRRSLSASTPLTEEEKRVYMESFKARDQLFEQKKRGPPIRQELPLPRTPPPPKKATPDKNMGTSLLATVLNEAANKPEKKGRGAQSAEVNWSATLARQKKEGGGAAPRAGEVLLDDSAKKAWLDMVTSPDRFRSFSTVEKKNSEYGGASVEDEVEEQNEDSTTAKIMSSKKKGIPLNLEELPNEILDDPNTPLAARLEYAAMVQEQQSQSQRERAKQQMEENEKILQQERLRLVELQRERDEVFRRKQEEAMTKKKEDEERKLKEQLEIKRKAEEKRQKLLEEQDRYWKQKLEEEQKLRDAKLKAIRDNQELQEKARFVGKEQIEKKAQEEGAKIRAEQLTRMKEEQMEKDRAKEAAAERARKLMEDTAKSVMEKEKSKDAEFKEELKKKNEADFIQNQKELRAEQERIREMQQEMLKEMSTVKRKDPPKKVVRQQLPLPNIGAPTPQNEPSKPATTPNKTKVDFTDDQKKKAKSFGINLDLLNG